MNGIELLDHLKRAHPGLPILAFSGTLEGCETPDRFDGILAKPFTLKEVHNIVEKFCPTERQF